MKYRPEIDGLRAIAVLPVVLQHAAIGPFSSGYAGVDIFFVISGYLITFILLEEEESRDFSIGKFYERRARRIMPALLLVISASSIVSVIYMFPLELNEFSQSVIATLLFSSNFFFYFNSDYFSTATELKPLLHTWSLAVEEQFYIVFPFLLHLLWRRYRRGSVLFAFSIVACASFSLCLLFAGSGLAFFLLPFRAWELLVGAISAIIVRQQFVSARRLPAILGLALILFSLTMLSDHRWPSAVTLFPVLGTALVLIFANSATMPGRLLTYRPFVQLGMISYSLYLWHQPVLTGC